jgi:hypothetical protein
MARTAAQRTAAVRLAAFGHVAERGSPEDDRVLRRDDVAPDAPVVVEPGLLPDGGPSEERTRPRALGRGR